MKYLCLVYLAPDQWHACPDESCLAYSNQLRDSGHLLAGQALHPTHTGTTVRMRNGQVSVTDGPFAETRDWNDSKVFPGTASRFRAFNA